jgi:hypothetical protein
MMGNMHVACLSCFFIYKIHAEERQVMMLVYHANPERNMLNFRDVPFFLQGRYEHEYIECLTLFSFLFLFALFIILFY